MVKVRTEAGFSSINNYQTTQCDDQGASCVSLTYHENIKSNFSFKFKF